MGQRPCGNWGRLHRRGVTQPTKRPLSLDDPYYTTEHLALLLPIGRTQLYALIKRDDFPRPMVLSDGGKYLWPAHEVREYLNSRPRVLNAPVRPAQSVSTVIRRPVGRRAYA